jgi:hypothetical protein
MSRMTVRLPGTLHNQLTTLAKREGISLNQYIVYALTRQVTLAYTIQSVPEQVTSQQQASFTALLQSLGQASFDEIEVMLAEREAVEPEVGLNAEAMRRLRQRFSGAQPPA